MKVKANREGSAIIIEAEGRKVLIGLTPFGLVCTDGENNAVDFEEIGALNEELIINEFGEDKAEYIGTCLGIVMTQIRAQLEAMNEYSDDCIDVDGEEVNRHYLE